MENKQDFRNRGLCPSSAVLRHHCLGLIQCNDKLLCLKSFKAQYLLRKSLKEGLGLQLVILSHKIVMLPDHKTAFPSSRVVRVLVI